MAPRSKSPRRWTQADARPALGLLASLRAPRDRRALMLLRCLDLWAPALFGTRLDPWNGDVVARRLASAEWRRSPDRWTGGDPPLDSLVDHLIRDVRYPLPAFLYPLVARTDGDLAFQLLAFLGGGGALREAPGLPPLSRRAAHLLWSTERADSVYAAVRSVQVAEAGGPAWLGEALAGTALGRAVPDEPRWAAHIGFLARHAAELERDRLRSIVDFLATGRPAPTSVSRLLREEREWHAAFAVRPGASWPPPTGPLPRSGLDGARFRDGEVGHTITELETAEALVAEGAAMGHCVATYVGVVRGGRSSIWSMRRDGERCLTLEVWNADRAVVQIRGHRNRRAVPAELAVVDRWARAEGLTVRDR